jgi:hypothetical protein
MAPTHTERREPRAVEGPRLERAIVLQLLRDDHRPRWSREELAMEIDAETLALEEALIRLDGAGVIGLAEDAVWASRTVRAVDELGLIAV